MGDFLQNHRVALDCGFKNVWKRYKECFVSHKEKKYASHVLNPGICKNMVGIFIAFGSSWFDDAIKYLIYFPKCLFSTYTYYVPLDVHTHVHSVHMTSWRDCHF
jgi:hypothetical protein